MKPLKHFCLFVAAVVTLNFAPIFSLSAQPVEAEALHKQVLELYRAGKYTDAIPLAERLLAIRKKFLGPSHPDVALSLNNLALLYKAQGRYGDAEPLYRLALTSYENAFGPVHLFVAASLNNLAGLYDSQDRPEDAEPLYKRSLAIYEKALGSKHRHVTTALNNLALHYYTQDRFVDAEPLVRRTLEQRSAEKNIAFPVLFQSGQQNLIAAVDAFNNSFDLVQRVASSAATNAMSKLAARIAAGPDKELSALIRKDQDLTAEAERLEKIILVVVSKPPAERNAAAEDQLRKRIDAIKLDQDKLRQSFNLRYPDYVALSKPKPLSLNETQALLDDDEALVVFDFDAKSYAWIVTRTSSDWVELHVSAQTLDAHVKELRESLKAEGNLFDTFLARWIYRETFGVFADKILSKTRLSVVTNGALTSLPLHLLVTKDPGDNQYKDVDWLARSFAITVWPSVANMKILRGKSVVSPAPKPLIAFADPVFSKKERKQPVDNVSMRSIADFYRGAQIDYDELIAALRQLPGTRKEVEAVAQALNADPIDVKLGLAATESSVKQAKLDQYRIVYFATHGLAAGLMDKFFSTKAEPAVALTAPDKRNEFDDGFLYASEVAQLKLNADWVVLSASDTVAGDEPGAEALSGLARAFFYAGGRSVVVSHWEVNDEQAAYLMTNTFQASARDERLTHAQALQQSMLAMLKNAKSNDEAHPRLWASFAVIGEPPADDSDTCYKVSGDVAIATCSRLIASGRFRAGKLAALYDNRGVEYRSKGQHDRAIADHNEAIRLDPKYSKAYKNRGDVYRDQGDYDGAIANYNQTILLNPNDASAFNERGSAYSSKNEYDRANADYDQAIRLDPTNALPFNNLGNTFELKSDKARAAPDFDEATRLQPTDADAWNKRCLARAIVGSELQQALLDCNESLRLRANDAATLDSRGFTYLKLGDVDNAIADYDAALEIDQKLATSLYGRGLAKRKKGDVDGSNADIALAKSIKSDIVEDFARYGVN